MSEENEEYSVEELDIERFYHAILFIYPDNYDPVKSKKIKEALKREHWRVVDRHPAIWQVEDSLREMHEIGMFLQQMAEYGVVCFAPDSEKDKKCRILASVAKEYGIRQLVVKPC